MATLEVTSPLKQGIKVQKWYAKNTELNSLKDLFLCISQGIGERPEVYGQGGHNGLDFVYEKRTSVYACHSGEGTYKEERDENGNLKGYGKYYTIIGEGFKTHYAHLDEGTLDRYVQRGELIGYGDSTGFSSSHHLHLTVKLTDNQGNVLNRDNGRDGAIDPTSYFVWFDNMKLTKNQVLALQALEGYFDPQGAEYWSNKELEDYLKARVKDKIKELQKYE